MLNITSSDIRQFIIQKFPATRKRPMNDDTLLLESGLIDSLGILDVVAFLERSFNIAITDEELTPDNFANINCMASFVRSKQSQDQASGNGGSAAHRLDDLR